VLSPRSAAFGEYTYFRDEFAGVEHRNAVVGGVSYKVLNQAAQVLSVDGGLGYLNAPVPGFKSTDTTTAIALVAKF